MDFNYYAFLIQDMGMVDTLPLTVGNFFKGGRKYTNKLLHEYEAGMFIAE